MISGGFAQNDIRFDVNSRNRQCTANSVVFLAFAYIIKENWKNLDIDSILMLGDHIYTISYHEAIRIKPRTDPFLAANEIKQEILVNINRLNRFQFSVICHAITEKEYSGNFDRFAKIYIELFFTNYSSGIFVCCSISIALHKFEEQYLLFDL